MQNEIQKHDKTTTPKTHKKRQTQTKQRDITTNSETATTTKRQHNNTETQ